MKKRPKIVQPGCKVVVKKLPPQFLKGLPSDVQEAIKNIIGKPVLFNEYDTGGRAELQFTDYNGTIHFIWMEPRYIEASE